MIEPLIENVGFNQGKLVRREKIPKNNKGDLFTWKDFNIGIDICTYVCMLIVFFYIDSFIFDFCPRETTSRAHDSDRRPTWRRTTFSHTPKSIA